METEINHSKVSEIKHNARLAEENSKGFMEPEPPKAKGGARPGSGRKPKSEQERAEHKAKRDAQKQKATGASGPQPGSTQAENPFANIPTKALMFPIAGCISTLGVQYVKHPQAAMTPDELDGLSTALGMVCDKYLPDVASKYGPEMLLVLHLSQYSIRLVQLKRTIEAQQRNQPKERPVSPEPGTDPKPDLKESFQTHVETN